MRHYSVLFVSVGETHYHTQEYVAWCHGGADGVTRPLLRTFDVPMDVNDVMILQMASVKISDPPTSLDWSSQGETMDGPAAMVEEAEEPDSEDPHHPLIGQIS